MKSGKMLVWAVLAAALSLGCASAYAAPAYPRKPINIVVPFGAGGGQTVLARAVAASAKLSKPMVVTNVPGGGGAIGAMEVYHNAPDGYTVLCSTPENVAAGAINGTYAIPTAWKDFVKVASVGGDAMIVLASKASGLRSLDDVKKRAAAEPGKISICGVTSKSYTHAVVKRMLDDLKLDLHWIPYDGEAASRTAVMGGHVDLVVFGVSAAHPAIDSGDAFPICVLSAKRSSFYPDVPTINELTGLNYDFTIYRAYFLPPKTPKAIADTLAAALKECVDDPKFKATMDGLYYETAYMGPEDLGKFIAFRVEETEKMFKAFDE